MTIRNRAAFNQSHFDWGFLRDGKTSGGDIDYMREINGHMLIIESKSYGAPLRTPYRIAFENLTKYNSITAIVAWGDPGTNRIQQIQIWHEGRAGRLRDANNDDLRAVVDSWTSYARENRPA